MIDPFNPKAAQAAEIASKAIDSATGRMPHAQQEVEMRKFMKLMIRRKELGRRVVRFEEWTRIKRMCE